MFGSKIGTELMFQTFNLVQLYTEFQFVSYRPLTRNKAELPSNGPYPSLVPFGHLLDGRRQTLIGSLNDVPYVNLGYSR